MNQILNHQPVNHTTWALVAEFHDSTLFFSYTTIAHLLFEQTKTKNTHKINVFRIEK
jgi:hypothetical protein